MAKMRVYELAKMLEINSKEILKELNKMGVEVKTHSSSISDDHAERIKKIFSPVQKAKKEGGAQKKEFQKKEPQKKESHRKESQKRENQSKERPDREKQGEKKQKSKNTKSPDTPTVDKKKPLKKAKTEEYEEIEIPDKFKKEIEVKKVEKIKSKASMERAFQSIRKIEQKKIFEPKYGKKGGRNRPQHRHSPQNQNQKQKIITTAPRKKVIKIQEGTTVKEFAELIGQKLAEVIKKFMELGAMPTINQPVDMDAAMLIADSYGIKVESTTVEDLDVDDHVDDISHLMPRSPVVTVMGHVDHGKTSLLDAIRETKVTESEAGGITQHIGAYKVNLKGKEIVFLDTPGHEAFTAMRARGAKVTDIVVLVVAADDGVKPQTVEAINHAKAAGVPIVVAVNKIDKADADIARVKSELSEHEVVPEEWGGSSIFAEVSAKQREGIEELLEMIVLQSEVMELKANPDRPARGVIIESRLDKGRGAIATVLIQTGTLHISDSFIAGIHFGKVRALNDDVGRKVDNAGPSTPVEVVGFSDVPNAGDPFGAVEDEKKARQISLARKQKTIKQDVVLPRKLNLEEIHLKIKEGEIKTLNIILKADVQGSIEAIKSSLEDIKHTEVKVKVIHTSVGGINESDIMLASASNAIVLGFNVRADIKAVKIAEAEGIDIRFYTVIYDAINDIKKALEGMLEPTLNEKVLGLAEVRKTFSISKIGTIAGCYVVEGAIHRSSHGVRVIRDNIVIYNGKIATLKRFQEDVKEAQTGYECGILVENFNDIKVGDMLENYIIEKISTKLE